MYVNDVVPPTVFLPPLKLLEACPQQEISHAIASLRHIYIPEVRGSSRRRHAPRPAVADATRAQHSHLTLDSWHIKEKAKSNDLSAIRADHFERTFAIQWLTRFISLFSEVIAGSPGSLPVSSQALEDAASLLAICAGSAASGTVVRTFTFPLSSEVSAASPELISTRDDDDLNRISVILRDAPLESSDFSSVGAQTWGGSCILAEMIAENPQNFSIYPREDFQPRSPGYASAPFRALELGAGTGLASLVLGKVLWRIRGIRHRSQEGWSSTSPEMAKIVNTVIATDFHPSVLANLRSNFSVNFPPEVPDFETHPDDDGIRRSSEPADVVAPNMVVLPLDWSVIHSLAHPIPSPRIGSSFYSPDTEIILTNQSSPPSKYTTTSFPSEARTSDRTDIICDLLQLSDNTNVERSPCPIPSQLDVIPFDLILGADIIYERSHAQWVRTCVERFLRKPIRPILGADQFFTASVPAPGTCRARNSLGLPMDQRSSPAMFHLVIPLRHTHAVECHSVEEVFLQARDILLSRQQAGVPLQPSSGSSGTADGPGIPCQPDYEIMSSSADDLIDVVGLELGIMSQEDISCDAYSDRNEGEVVYRYYRIGWV